jgi:hypothetical protein
MISDNNSILIVDGTHQPCQDKEWLFETTPIILMWKSMHDRARAALQGRVKHVKSVDFSS